MSKVISTNKSTEKEILDHLKKCNNDFIPSLSSYIDLELYSYKLFSKAVRFEYFVHNELAGLLAFYVLEKEGISFLTNLSVLRKYHGQGIASLLLSSLVNFNKKNKLTSIKLEVSNQNKPAYLFYMKNDFSLYESNDKSQILIKKI